MAIFSAPGPPGRRRKNNSRRLKNLMFRSLSKQMGIFKTTVLILSISTWQLIARASWKAVPSWNVVRPSTARTNCYTFWWLNSPSRSQFLFLRWMTWGGWDESQICKHKLTVFRIFFGKTQFWSILGFEDSKKVMDLIRSFLVLIPSLSCSLADKIRFLTDITNITGQTGLHLHSKDAMVQPQSGFAQRRKAPRCKSDVFGCRCKLLKNDKSVVWSFNSWHCFFIYINIVEFRIFRLNLWNLWKRKKKSSTVGWNDTIVRWINIDDIPNRSNLTMTCSENLVLLCPIVFVPLKWWFILILLIEKIIHDLKKKRREWNLRKKNMTNGSYMKFMMTSMMTLVVIPPLNDKKSKNIRLCTGTLLREADMWGVERLAAPHKIRGGTSRFIGPHVFPIFFLWA